MLAYLKSARFYNGAIKDGHFAGPNAAELIDMLVKDTRYKDPALYKKVVPNGCDPDGHVYQPSLETDLAFWQEQKFIEGKASVDEVLDHSYVDAALKTLGPVQGLMTEAAIRISGLSKRFATRNGPYTALDRIGLDIARGSFCTIVGPSGCGKTTLLRILAGLEAASAGEAADVADDPAKPVNAMVFQGNSIFPWMTVWNNAAYGLAHARRAQGPDPRGGRPLPRPHRAYAVRRPLSAPAFGRHEAARRRSPAPLPPTPKSC